MSRAAHQFHFCGKPKLTLSHALTRPMPSHSNRALSAASFAFATSARVLTGLQCASLSASFAREATRWDTSRNRKHFFGERTRDDKQHSETKTTIWTSALVHIGDLARTRYPYYVPTLLQGLRAPGSHKRVLWRWVEEEIAPRDRRSDHSDGGRRTSL